MNLKEDFYQKANAWWWTGRTDEGSPGNYFHEIVSCLDVLNDNLPALKNDKGFGLIGYCCQEGVRRNHGRIGAAHGPRAIRTMLGPLAVHYNTIPRLMDLGNIHCLHEEMEATQILLSKQVNNLLNNSYLPILMGGGHDIAYGHFLGIQKFLGNKKKKLGIINLDAHFDLRVNLKNGHSGTPFYQISQCFENPREDFHYLCLGIQPDSNSELLFDTAKSLGVEYLFADQMTSLNIALVTESIQAFMSKIDHVYLSIDLDGFASAFAPGVSAPSPMGFTPQVAMKIIDDIVSSGKLLCMDIAELNPTLDQDNCTARLAARLINHTITALVAD